SCAKGEDRSLTDYRPATWLAIPNSGAHGLLVRFVDLRLSRLACRVEFRCGVIRLRRIWQFLAEALRAGRNAWMLFAIFPQTTGDGCTVLTVIILWTRAIALARGFVRVWAATVGVFGPGFCIVCHNYK